MITTFPTIYSTLATDALSSDVLPKFGIGKISECVFFSGGFNDTYRVKTVDGRTFYLRAYRRLWRSLADIQYELDVLNYLKEKGFPAARPVPYQSGEFYCEVRAPEGTRYLALFKEAPGQEVSYEDAPEKMAQRYGQAVAEMHNALNGFNSQHQRFHKDLAHFIDMPLKNVAPFLKHRPDDWDYFLGFAEKVRQKIQDLPADALEQGFCHGDLQGYHANIAKDEILTFYDFDCGGYGFRAYDLAVFLWCCRLEEAIGERWEPFLKGYQERREINDLDLQAVPFFVCCRYLWHMGVHTQNAPDWGVAGLDEKYFDAHLKRLHQADEDYLKDNRHK
jgi:Ser/Thr protein kinase RdoA (MazF antagonist)